MSDEPSYEHRDATAAVSTAEARIEGWEGPDARPDDVEPLPTSGSYPIPLQGDFQWRC